MFVLSPECRTSKLSWFGSLKRSKTKNWFSSNKCKRLNVNWIFAQREFLDCWAISALLLLLLLSQVSLPVRRLKRQSPLCLHVFLFIEYIMYWCAATQLSTSLLLPPVPRRALPFGCKQSSDRLSRVVLCHVAPMQIHPSAPLTRRRSFLCLRVLISSMSACGIHLKRNCSLCGVRLEITVPICRWAWEQLVLSTQTITRVEKQSSLWKLHQKALIMK